MDQRTRSVRPQTAPQPLVVGPPPRGWALAGWALLPLRLFLGVTFTFAALQKMANPAFFDKNSAGGIYAQMLHADGHSPLTFLLGHLLQFSTPLGWLMAFGELAVGLGLLIGLWGRIAALGGAVIAFSLFLVISFHTNPYYLGSDLIYCMAFVPFIIGGTPVLSVDAWVTARAAAKEKAEDPTVVAVTFGTVRSVCSNATARNMCKATSATCTPKGCPFLVADHASIIARRTPNAEDRRKVVLGGSAAAAAAAAAVVTGVATATIGKSNAAPTSTTTPVTLPSGNTGTTTPNGAAIGAAASVPVGGSATFTVPDGSGAPGIVLQPTAGKFVAFNAACTHQGCPVSYAQGQDLLVCPCHGSQFNPANGSVEVGPAVTGLTEYTVTVENGQIYVKV